MRRRPSLYTRLALGFAASLVGLTVVTTGAVLAGYAYVLHTRVDRRLSDDLAAWAPRVAASPDGPSWASPQAEDAADRAAADGGPFLRLLDPDGHVRWASASLDPWPPLPGRVDAPPPRTQSRPWGGTYARSTYAHAGGGWVEATRFETDPHTGVWTLANLLLAGFVLSAAAAGALGRVLARRALRPVRELHRTAEAVGAGTLDRRIPTDTAARDELSDLADTFNRMLDRLQDSFDRERRFTADAAHELLTPLARMRAEAELALRSHDRAADPRPVFEALLGEVDGLAALADGLLRSARGHARHGARPETVDLSAVCAGALDRADALAQAHEIQLTGTVEPGLAVRADRLGVEEAVQNVLANALKYTPAGGDVHLSLARHADRARLSVRDSGVGFEPGEAARAFERFYRSDRPDVQARPGSGLGLALVQETAAAAGGRAWVESAGAGHGSTVHLELPLHPPPY